MCISRQINICAIKQNPRIAFCRSLALPGATAAAAADARLLGVGC